MDKTKDEQKHLSGESTAQACFEGIEIAFKELDEANEKGDVKTVDRLDEEINEYAYGVHVTKNYEITLAGGGPSCWIEGELDEHNEPYNAKLMYSWANGPKELYVSEELLLRFAQRHYFGE